MASRRKSYGMKVIADEVEEDADVSEEISRLEAEADRELAAGSVTLRWGRSQIAVVKRAAAILGVPYQTYLKQVVFRQALADIERAETVLPTPKARRRTSGTRPRRV